MYRVAAFLAILVLTVVIMVYAKPFLVPLTFAAILSMLLLPFTVWLQRKGLGKAVAILISLLSLILFIGMAVFFISFQVASIAKDANQLENQVVDLYHQTQDYISERLDISPEKQEEIIEEESESSATTIGSQITGFLTGLGTFLVNSILVVVYIFLFIYFRTRLKGFVIKMVATGEQDKAKNAVNKVQKVSAQYLSGLFMMIVCLWIMYGIGFSIIGVKNALFFAVLCGLLEIVPFVGNLTGTALTVSMSLVQGGGMSLVIGILVTYGIIQFIQTYILEPLVVGAQVNLNPLFTIVGIVAFESVWGIPGMILAIPLIGMFKIVCEYVEPLKPYAYLIGSEQDSSSTGFSEKLNEWIRKIRNKKQ